MSNRAEILKQRYQQSVGLPFAQVLSESEIAQVLEEQWVSYRQVLYTPMVVSWAWISQVLDEDKSLSNAVKRAAAWLVAAGEERPSSDTGGYSKARKRLPLSVLPPLLKRSAKALGAELSPEQLWCGRRVKAFDGTSLLMSDTTANQKRYPQHRQKEGCGFPIAKVVVWFCVVTDAAFVSNRPICAIVSDSARCLLCFPSRWLGLSQLGSGCMSRSLSSSNATGEEQRASFVLVLTVYVRSYSTSTLASMTFYRSRDFCPVLR